ncbi:MAG: Uma2 family endonuclease [Bryobacteraceae bacterium]|nr:Uma2 family endonuclease [Bryobacteraceae bacterium]
MATAVAPREPVVIVDATWETYERMLEENKGRNGIRITFDRGALQLMVMSARHERPNRILAEIVARLAHELKIDVEPFGSTTIKREDQQRGFEPDSSFYIRHAARMRERQEVDWAHDPPPDLIIEVDVTSDSLNRFPIFAAFGVPEVWRYREPNVEIFELQNGAYRASERSLAFPIMSTAELSRWVAARAAQSSWDWEDALRAWIRAQKP